MEPSNRHIPSRSPGSPPPPEGPGVRKNSGVHRVTVGGAGTVPLKESPDVLSLRFDVGQPVRFLVHSSDSFPREIQRAGMEKVITLSIHASGNRSLPASFPGPKRMPA